MKEQTKALIAMWVVLIAMISALIWATYSIRTARQTHQITMLMISIEQNRNSMEHLNDIIDDQRMMMHEGAQLDQSVFAISEQRGMVRSYLHRDCRNLVLYDRVIESLKMKPEMELVKYCKENFDVGLGRFE